MSDERVDIEPAALVLGWLGELQGLDEDTWLEGPLQDVGLRLYRLQVMANRVRRLIEAIETDVAGRMERDTADLGPFGLMRRSMVTSSTWRDESAAERMRDDLAVAVAQQVAIDVGTGEIDPVKRNVAMATMRAAYEAIPSFSTLKQAGRTRLGLHIGDYRSYFDRYRVVVEALEDEGD